MEDVKKDIAIEMFMLDWIRRKHDIGKFNSDTNGFHAWHAIGSGPEDELTAHLMINGYTQVSYTLDEILKDIE